MGKKKKMDQETLISSLFRTRSAFVSFALAPRLLVVSKHTRNWVGTIPSLLFQRELNWTESLAKSTERRSFVDYSIDHTTVPAGVEARPAKLPDLVLPSHGILPPRTRPNSYRFRSRTNPLLLSTASLRTSRFSLLACQGDKGAKAKLSRKSHGQRKTTTTQGQLSHRLHDGFWATTGV